MPSSATSAERNIQLKVEHQCPQCGAPITLGEETLFFLCPFCRVRSCISQKGYPRYIFSLSDRTPEGCDPIFLPYWRFKGVWYSASLTGVAHRFLDLSALALEQAPAHIPLSLGLRSQALTLKRISPDTPGKFVRPQPLKSILTALESRTRPPGKRGEATFQEMIGETASLIFSPFYIHNTQVFDGILNLPLQDLTPREMEGEEVWRPEQATLFIPGLCPDCGWDLEGNSDSLVLACFNCHTLWQPRGDRLGKIRYGCARAAHASDVMLPFWKIEAQIPSLNMASHEEVWKKANPGLFLDPEGKNQLLNFWAPAFKLQPKVFLRVTVCLSLAQPDPPLEKKFGKNSLLPVTLPASEGVQTIRLTLASLVRPLENMLPLLDKARVTSKSITLVFLPFESHHHEVVHPGLNLAIPKTLLALSKNL